MPSSPHARGVLPAHCLQVVVRGEGAVCTQTKAIGDEGAASVEDGVTTNLFSGFLVWASDVTPFKKRAPGQPGWLSD